MQLCNCKTRAQSGNTFRNLLKSFTHYVQRKWSLKSMPSLLVSFFTLSLLTRQESFPSTVVVGKEAEGSTHQLQGNTFASTAAVGEQGADVSHRAEHLLPLLSQEIVQVQGADVSQRATRLLLLLEIVQEQGADASHRAEPLLPLLQYKTVQEQGVDVSQRAVCFQQEMVSTGAGSRRQSQGKTFASTAIRDSRGAGSKHQSQGKTFASTAAVGEGV